jgi:hypothetical protein
MRLFVFIPYLFFALAFVVFGVVAFVKIGGEERQLQDKLGRIHAGELQAESLTVIRKYAYSARDTHYHLVLRGSKEAHVNEIFPLALYDLTKPGDKITAYYFPADGYFIPQSLSAAVNDRPAAKWVFLFSGMGMALLVSLLGLWRFKRPPRSDFPGSLSDGITNRMRQA